MSEPVFATKWHFLLADVLFGVHAQTGELLLVTDAAGQPTWMCWTDLELATSQLPPGYVLQHAAAREMLQVLPQGVGVVIDPATERTMTVPADYADELRGQSAVFPGGVVISWRPWVGLPKKAVKRLVGLGGRYGFLNRLWFAEFRIENGPPQGAIVYDCAAGDEAEESVVDSITDVLDRYVDLAELPGPPVGIQVVALSDTPEQTREWLLGQVPAFQR